MPFSRGSRIGPVLACVVLIVMLNTWFAVASVRTMGTSEYWLSHTWEVIGQVESLQSAANGGEASARGYILTGNDRFLTEYYGNRQQILAVIGSLKGLTIDNPRQQKLIKDMLDAVSLRYRILDHNIQTRRTEGVDAAAAEVATMAGADQMERFRQTATDAQDEERRLLSVREVDVRRSYIVALIAIGLASGLDLLLLLLLGRFLVRERELRLDTERANQQLATANAEIARNTEEITALNRDLEERVRLRTAELESTNRELEAFSYSVSHDLRAPLRTIDGFSLALEEDYQEAVDETGRDYIRRVRAGVQRMGSLIDALLQLSRITRAEITRQQVDVTALAESVARNLQEENPNQQIHFDIQSGMEAYADAQLLRVAFENLLGNAVKFSSKVPVSLIRVGYNADRKWFEVGDNGAGFDMSYSSKLFNAFNRLHGDKDFKGSGIGLATVARVIRRHHGTISAESQVGHGARFFFTLG